MNNNEVIEARWWRSWLRRQGWCTRWRWRRWRLWFHVWRCTNANCWYFRL